MSLVERVMGAVSGYILTVFIQPWCYLSFGVGVPFGKALVTSLIIIVAAFSKNLSVRKQLNLNARARFSVA